MTVQQVYNPNMTLYFLSSYMEQKEVPQELVDINIISVVAIKDELYIKEI